MLRGVGPKLKEKLARLNIHTVQDLLFHLPTRYEDRTRIRAVGTLRPGERALVRGDIEHAEIVYRGRRMLAVVLADGTGSLTLRFFHFSAAQQNRLKRGQALECFGEVRAGRHGLEMVHPEYRLGGDDHPPDDFLTPVYPTTEGLPQSRLRKLSHQALERLRLAGGLEEWLPDDLRASLKLATLKDALLYVHRPPTDADLAKLAAGKHPAQQRLLFEELLAHHLSLRRLRRELQNHPATALKTPGPLTERFLAALPFKLTAAQTRVAGEISSDLAQPRPMLRLLQGDVGSGKTVIAALAALQAAEAGMQTALVAPTELLAEQHLRNFRHWFEPLGLPTVWLTGKIKGKAREQALLDIAQGAPVVIGTHALMQEGVKFKRLALVIVDEQHRFGVHQRLQLRDKGVTAGVVPHQMVMTATPIPRTLSMSAYADLDTSVIDELPPGRKPAVTVALPESRREEVIRRVSEACNRGQQAYWVCTLIEESETLQAQTATDTAQRLSIDLPKLRIGLVHGRLKAEQKEQVMSVFAAGDLDLLVATTVIEVGVDVPRANLMIVENAERLGLSQLHQLRSRIGRGGDQSHCVLMYKPPLTDNARLRLTAMRETTDGFEISRLDLELRGPGEVLGTRQTGMLEFRIADLMRDRDWLPRVHDAARQLMRDYPSHVDPLIARWIGTGTRYSQV